MQSPAQTKPSRSALLLILVVVFINMAGFSLILPLLPFYGREFHATPVEITSLFAAYSFGNIFGEIVWGRVSDRRGRKRVLTFTIGGAAVSYVAFAFAQTLAAALAIRVVSGLFSGTMGVCQSYIADVTPPESRPLSMGYFGAAMNLGIAIGPAVGGVLARPELGLAGFRLPILVSAAVSAASALWTACVLKESPAHRHAGALDWAEAFRFVARDPLLVRLFAIAFVAIGAFASMEAVFGLWTQRNFGWSAHQVGLTFVAVGATGMTVQLLLIGPLSRRFGEARVIVLGLLVLGASMVLQPILRSPLAAVALMSTLMGGHGLTFPNVGSLVSRSTRPGTQGSVLGVQMATNAFARIVAPPAFGLIYAAGPDAPYYAGAVMVVGALVLAIQAVRIRESALRDASAAAAA